MPGRLIPALFSIVRAGCGVYCAFFFSRMLGFPSGLLAELDLPFLEVHPFPLSAAWFAPVLWVGIAAGGCLLLGAWRRAAAPVAWACLVIVLNRDSLLREVQFDYLGWMLLLFAFVPAGEPLALAPRPKTGWALPREFRLPLLLCFGASYSLSGLAKLATGDWTSGRMLAQFHGLGFGGPGGLSGVYAPLAIAVAALQAAALPLVVWAPGRPWIWAALTALQAGLLAFTRLSHISFVMLLFHLLLVEQGWWKRRERSA